MMVEKNDDLKLNWSTSFYENNENSLVLILRLPYVWDSLFQIKWGHNEWIIEWNNLRVL